MFPTPLRAGTEQRINLAPFQTLTLEAVAVRAAGGSKVMVLLSAPVTPEFLESIAPELGPIHFLVMRPVAGESLPDEQVMLNKSAAAVKELATHGANVSAVPPADTPALMAGSAHVQVGVATVYAAEMLPPPGTR